MNPLCLFCCWYCVNSLPSYWLSPIILYDFVLCFHLISSSWMPTYSMTKDQFTRRCNQINFILVSINSANCCIHPTRWNNWISYFLHQHWSMKRMITFRMLENMTSRGKWSLLSGSWEKTCIIERWKQDGTFRNYWLSIWYWYSKLGRLIIVTVTTRNIQSKREREKRKKKKSSVSFPCIYQLLLPGWDHKRDTSSHRFSA